MYNWSVDTSKLKKNSKKFKLFGLEQAINFGLNGKKLSKSDMLDNWLLLNIDAHKRKYLGSLLWPK